jgi:tetratricopeptide (TPR) repeat protein
MFRRGIYCTLVLVPALSFGALAQKPAASRSIPAASGAAGSGAALRKAIELAEASRCDLAIPLLKRELGRSRDRALELRGGLDAIKCAMTMNEPDVGVQFVLPLQRDFPDDPEVLYLATHVYSTMAEQVSRRLIMVAPASYQVHELNAEALEQQGKWQEARAEYEVVLKKDPTLVGIHYRIGESLLSQPGGTAEEQAKRASDARLQFEEELKLDPTNAGAEFVLGELARQQGDFAGAAPHFARATTLDPNFIEALLALADAQLHLRQFAQALPTLLAAERMQPQNPTVHFLLAKAYMGEHQAAKRDEEIALFQKTQRTTQLTRDQIEKQLLSDEPPPGAQP